MERDENGRPVKAVGIIRDITEQKNAEHALTELNIKLEATLQSTADGIEAVDLDGNFFFTTSSLKDVGLPDLITKESTFSYIRERLSNRNESLNSIQDFLKHLEHEPFRELHLTDGRTFERYANPIVVGGAVEGYVLSYRDISERKKEKTRFSTSVITISSPGFTTGRFLKRNAIDLTARASSPSPSSWATSTA